MTEYIPLLWLLAGLAAGLTHAGLLRHESHGVSAWSPVRGLIRIIGIVLILVLAAQFGGLLSAAAGWGFGFLPAVCWLARAGFERPPAAPSLICEPKNGNGTADI